MTLLRHKSNVMLIWNRGFSACGFSFEGMKLFRHTTDQGGTTLRIGPFFYFS
jgi:hypothetical protein